jgi:MFS family permease
VSSSDGLNRFRTRFFLAAALLGAVAGILAGLSRDEPRTAWALAMVSPILLFMGGGMGTFLGMILAATRERWRGRKPDLDPAATDAAMLLGVFGALLGLVLAVFSGAHAEAHLWTAAGAFVGGLAESFSGRVAAVLLHLTVLDELSDEERARERRTAGQEREKDLEHLLEDAGDRPSTRKKP